ncbi:MAG: hypothetical protein KJ755_08930, partial [Alphaproteobacteria bacterium]|nr:hypothetical protein [Alphaproteobacteria bacterium]
MFTNLAAYRSSVHLNTMKFPRNIDDQPPGHFIDVADWEYDEEFGIHPVGSKPKKMLTAPNDIALPFIIP